MQKPIDEFKNRFNKILSLKDVKPVELAEKTGLSKSTISHYMSGYTKPKSDRLYMLAKTLNVNEAWLMGYDVPMERDTYEDQNIITFDAIFNKVIAILKDARYKIIFSDDDELDSDIIIKNYKNDILSCMHDYDLVARHESLRKAGKDITAETILKNSTDDFTSVEKTLIKKYRTLDLHGKDMVNMVLNKEAERMKELETSQATVIDIHPRLENNTRFIEYHHSASAGTGVFILGSEGVDQLSIPDTPENRKVDYAIKVSGNSMEPDYNDGDIVLVSQKVELNHGDVGIFIINNNAYIKEYGETELISWNPEADNITISEYDNIVCMGKVVGKYEE